jgi:hypothetical protein
MSRSFEDQSFAGVVMMVSLISRVASILLGCAGIFISLNNASFAKEVDICYMKKASGYTVLLNKLCETKSRSSVGGEGKMKPGEFKLRPDGLWEVMPGDKPVTTPDGYVVYPDGRFSTPSMEGYTMQFILRNGEPIGAQYYTPDGTPMKVGESRTLSSGHIITQSEIEIPQ